MTQDDNSDAEAQARDRREQRAMWIFSGAIVLVILGAMGARMIWGHDTTASSTPTDISSQSRPAPQSQP